MFGGAFRVLITGIAIGVYMRPILISSLEKLNSWFEEDGEMEASLENSVKDVFSSILKDKNDK